MNLNQLMIQFVYLALMCLSMSLMTSVSLSIAYQILLLPPLVYFFKKFEFRNLPKSAWCLLGLNLVMLLSILVNLDTIAHPFKNIIKLRYYVWGALAILPLRYYLNDVLKAPEKNKILQQALIVLMVFSAVADLLGLIGYFTGFHPWLQKDDHGRNGGVLGRVMTYGHASAWLGVFLAGLWSAMKKRSEIVSPRILLGLLGLSFFCLYTTHTRGAWLAFLAGCLVLKRKLAVGFLILFLVVGGSAWILNPEVFQSRLIREGSNGQRIGSWVGAWKAFQEKPLLGYGFLNFGPQSVIIKTKYQAPHAYFEGHAHQEFLEMLATTGLLGGALFLGWLGFWISEMRQRKDAVGRVVFALITAFLVSGLTQVTLTDGQNAFFIMAIYTFSQVL